MTHIINSLNLISLLYIYDQVIPELEALKGNRKDQYSIRINKQWRICFKWLEGNVQDVEIIDYH